MPRVTDDLIPEIAQICFGRPQVHPIWGREGLLPTNWGELNQNQRLSITLLLSLVSREDTIKSIDRQKG